MFNLCRKYATPSPNFHIEFYVGNNYEIVYENQLGNKEARNSAKKSYDWQNKFPKRSGDNKLTGSSNTLRAEGTFAWGDVKDEYPSESKDGKKHYFYYDTILSVFKHCECGFWNPLVENQHSSSCSINPNNENYGRKYTIIWRKR